MRGKLSVVDGKITLEWTSLKLEKTFRNPVKLEQLAQNLREFCSRPGQTVSNMEVEYRLVDKRPAEIREYQSKPGTPDRAKGARGPTTDPSRNGRGEENSGYRFENPYNFVPAPPRMIEAPELGDHEPVGHYCYHTSHWSGRITVELTTKTPLLILDNGTENPKGHKIFGVRQDDSGAPFIAPTSLKGMLRSAYEAITNSRMGVWGGNSDAFGYWKWDPKLRRPVKHSYNAGSAELLPESNLPAKSLAKLSPADRVFGWVGDKQHKGQLRIGAVECVQGKEAIESMSEGVALTILGAPKPAQSRFYAAKNPNGEPYDRGIGKAQTYRPGHGLRGRKAYPHQPQSALQDYWQTSSISTGLKLGMQPVYQEWKRVGGTRNNQNRTITAWVKPQTSFRFHVEVINLSEVELGALLWMLNMPQDHYFRLGGGKPLGFGSVQLRIRDTDLRNGAKLAASYRSFGEPDNTHMNQSKQDEISRLIEAYQTSFVQCYASTGNFEESPIIRSFLNAAKGGELPVHYPRSTQVPQAKDENFKWFVANEKGDKLPLPAMQDDDRGLPIL